eukprot:CAMPEP_0113420138 /NCGR_PEP_ID=MMETSP0013_2-20120614/27172_1 /TAXON_ID=2843 ORGANISM="Skeletonema costatum, Strain 1716" /NCGR_SAMPLE_ID=MMETSP0013_2 /ASSEMBLY_ACC=CAM_ASM_000158 /LENGTH=316 /DNA_ID=CAMNT_0000307605 /DNA_START=18 /DNA_END=968 /DNA_ORIENTATION=- /assembly_acc=CAM_ASM_000158
MSTSDEAEAEEADNIYCASCGTAEVDDIELKNCDDCDLVRYCSDKCQQDHRPNHEAVCKERAVVLRDEILFRLPESSRGDCPICCLPISLDNLKSTLQTCCSKLICNGCVYANMLRERGNNLKHRCPFCRHPMPKTKKENQKNRKKRVAVKDPVALRELGGEHYGKGDYSGAVPYLTEAAAFGDMYAHYSLSIMYGEGKGVEKDDEMAWYHLEEAAIGGHHLARYNLAVRERENGRFDRAVKHFIIAANLGDDASIKQLRIGYIFSLGYTEGKARKEDFASALRAHQAAVDGMKSPQREAAAKAEAAGLLIDDCRA